MKPRLDTLLLLALPASGKSELRRYLASLDPERAAQDFGVGPTVQLDDYPYVHLMRRIDQEIRRLGADPVFFAADDQPLLEGRDWATLIELVNEDLATLGAKASFPREAGGWMLDRLDRARSRVGLHAPFDALAENIVVEVSAAIDDEVADVASKRAEMLASYEAGVSTVVIEFARGGPEGANPPLSDPHGYHYSLRYLSPDVLRKAVVLYVWVTPEESRRRNSERARPGLEGDASILHHGVPEPVLRADYGVDDFHWLLERGGGDTIEAELEGATFRLPAAVFDNRVDHTSFLRADPAEWDGDDLQRLHEELLRVFAGLV